MDRKFNVCIVEDCFIQSTVLKKILESSGFNITGIYRNGEDVLENFDAGNPDVYLLDISLKGEMNGFEVATYIRKKSITPILFVSGLEPTEISKQVSHIEYSSVEAKPIFKETFIESLKSLINTSEVQAV